MGKIEKIYEINRGNLAILFTDGKLVLLNGLSAGSSIPKWREKYGYELKNIEKASIEIERDYKKDASKDEILDIEKIDNNYWLIISGEANNYQIGISPQELKFLLFINEK